MHSTLFRSTFSSENSQVASGDSNHVTHCVKIQCVEETVARDSTYTSLVFPDFSGPNDSPRNAPIQRSLLLTIRRN